MYSLIITKGLPNKKVKGCYDCAYYKAAISWWCMNQDARIKYGGSAEGRICCDFWKPAKLWSSLSWWEKIINNDIKVEAIK